MRRLKSKAPVSRDDIASEQLMFVSGYVYRLVRAKARQLGFRWSALMVLADLDLLGPTEQRRLVAIEQVRGSTMTVLLQDLEKRGWLERVDHDADARVTLVSITASGRVRTAPLRPVAATASAGGTRGGAAACASPGGDRARAAVRRACQEGGEMRATSAAASRPDPA